ncbi:MAG TPA: copper chaperone PCu(A)C [Burkholderiaceae bacterium]
MYPKQFIAAAGLALATLVAQAGDARIGAITIEHARARATAPGQPIGGGYMTLVNGGGADRLVSVSAPVSKSAELHMMTMKGDVMEMRQVEAIDLPPGKTVALEPGGYHIMFVGLKAPLKAGESFPMTLKFAKAGEVTVPVKVEAPGNGHGMKH